MTETAKLRRREDVLDFLATRRSRPPACLGPDGPDRTEMEQLLTLAMRVPDHGKVEPWRLIVLTGESRARMAEDVQARGLELGKSASMVEKAAQCWRDGAVSVVVVYRPNPDSIIPRREQFLSAGCVCLSLLNACLAAGWGASWLTGFAATDDVIAAHLDIEGDEEIVGFIHIGSETTTPPERPRPDAGAHTLWLG